MNHTSMLLAQIIQISTDNWGMLFNAGGWLFTVGVTFGYLRTALQNLDKRIERIEHWIDAHE